VSLESAIYAGTLAHARRGPVPHAFRYRLYMLYLDLAELPALLAGRGPLRGGALGLLSFERADYLRGAADLAEEARLRVNRALGFRPAGPVRLLTHARSLGYVFNPVSFYFCFGADGERLEAVVAEITNTPWGERHAYVIRAAADGAAATFPKAFHVSPFLAMDHGYRWRIGVPGPSLVVEMVNERDGREAFRARLELKRRPWSGRDLWRAALGTPLVAWKVHAAIYWQALRLWAKGAPFFTHPHESAAAAARRMP
jgi:DUF1365 family protein